MLKKYKKNIEKIINQIMNIENETIIKELEKKVNFFEMKIKNIQQDKSILYELNIFEKRNIAEKYIEKIIYNNGKIEIAFK